MKKSASIPKPSAKDKLLNAALRVVRTKGYSGTTVDDLCAAAGVTKGAFFHHFESKDALAVAAADYWSTVTASVFAGADYRKLSDPLDRVLGYVDFRKALVRGQLPEFTCFVGTLVQEAFDSNAEIRAACERSIFGHAAEVAKDLAEAKKKYCPRADWSAESVGVFTQAAIQGAFIVAKAKDDPRAALECIEHLRRYVAGLFPSVNHRREVKQS
ncbi:MAG: TetR/AcrR family transcriptional regulator [Bdellovibrionales bacterium]|nr:TetR/AcrR family transcriptional regulator [Bdellovibrionales bacterium]